MVGFWCSLKRISRLTDIVLEIVCETRFYLVESAMTSNFSSSRASAAAASCRNETALPKLFSDPAWGVGRAAEGRVAHPERAEHLVAQKVGQQAAADRLDDAAEHVRRVAVREGGARVELSRGRRPGRGRPERVGGGGEGRFGPPAGGPPRPELAAPLARPRSRRGKTVWNG